MASELIVQTIQGPSSGVNANKVLIPSGHTLDVSGGTLVPSAGAVVQVVSANFTTDTTYSSSGVVKILGLDITPTSASSKILVVYNINAIWKSGSSSTSEANYYLYRDNAVSITHLDGITPYNGAAQGNSAGSIAGSFLDSPASTSTKHYSLEISVNAGSVRVNTEGGTCTITLMEIAQ